MWSDLCSMRSDKLNICWYCQGETFTVLSNSDPNVQPQAKLLRFCFLFLWFAACLLLFANHIAIIGSYASFHRLVDH